MKTFEERYTAWIDGQLTGAELDVFEKELDDRAAADADRLEVQHLGNLLKRFGGAPAISNPDFFNHQLMARIAADQPKQKSGEPRGLLSWPFIRFAWAGVFAVALGWMMARTFNPIAPTGQPVDGSRPAYLAQILETHTVDPRISATVVHAEQDNVTVLWLDGLEYLPASYELQ